MVGETYVYQYLNKENPLEVKPNPVIYIQNEDCLIAASQLLNSNEIVEVCVLNMANQYLVGGDYLSTHSAQEESLIHRTDLLDSLKKLEGVVAGNACNPFKYAFQNTLGFSSEKQRQGFGEFTSLYTEQVKVSRLKVEENSKLIHPFYVNVISSSAYNLADESAQQLSRGLYIAGTVFKILNQLRVAKRHQQRNLVLGAFGCGCFYNDPAFIAEVYHAVIHEYEFQGCFDHIIFAIKSPAMSDNFSAFEREFSGYKRPKLVRELLVDAVEEAKGAQKNNRQFVSMVTPFRYIESAAELVFFCRRIVSEELKQLENRKSENEKDAKKIQFLSKLLFSLEKGDEPPQAILKETLFSQACLTLNTHSRFFKTPYQIVNTLKIFLEDAPHLNPTQITLASDWFRDYIRQRIQEFIDCSMPDDKKNACYFIYIAMMKPLNVLKKEIASVLTEPSYGIVVQLLEEISEICHGGVISHNLVSSVLDLRFCGYGNDPRSQRIWLEENAKLLSHFYRSQIIGLLEEDFLKYYDAPFFEKFLEADIESNGAGNAMNRPCSP